VTALAATRRFVKALLDAGELELAEGEQVEAELVRDLATYLERARDGHAVGEWLASHPLIAETYATDEVLDRQLDAYRRARARTRVVAMEAADHGDLEAQILRTPDDDALRLVYGDWLVQQGDPLGELIVLHAQAARDPQAARAVPRLLSKHADHLFGRFAEYRKLFELDLHLGMIRGITIARRSKPIEIQWHIVLGWLLERRIAAFVQHLTIGPFAGAPDVEAALLDVIASEPRPALRSLAILHGGSRYGSTGEPVDLSPLAHGAPRLEQLTIHHPRVTTIPITHEHLRSLQLEVTWTMPELAGALADSRFLALESLAITGRLGSGSRLLLSRGLPVLSRLRLALEGDAPTEILRMLLGGPLLPQLRELALSPLDDDAAGYLLAHAERFAHLARLGLPGAACSDRVRGTLARLPNVEM
jgi:uncharacterized protein (TIGR02996 family)